MQLLLQLLGPLKLCLRLLLLLVRLLLRLRLLCWRLRLSLLQCVMQEHPTASHSVGHSQHSNSNNCELQQGS